MAKQPPGATRGTDLPVDLVDPLGVAHVVDRDRRHHRVERAADGFDPVRIAQVGLGELHPVGQGAEPLAGLLDHGLGEVVQHHAAVGKLLEHLAREHAVPAADVEDPYLGVTLEREELDEPAEDGPAFGVACDIRADPLVDIVGGVPVVVAVRVG